MPQSCSTTPAKSNQTSGWPDLTICGAAIPISLGIGVFPSAHGDVVGHGGLVDGYTSEMYFYPAEDVTIVVFTNTSDGYFDDPNPPEDIFADLLALVEERTF